MQALPKKDQLSFITAVCSYVFEEESKPVSGAPYASFLLVKPILDKANKKAENGKRGGSKKKTKQKQTGSKLKQTEANQKQTGSKLKQTEANQKQTGSKLKQTESYIKGEKEREVEVEVEVEVEGDTPSTNTLLTSGIGSPPLAAVFSAYMDKISPTPSTSSMEMLRGYVVRLGEEICLRAIDRAVDAGVRNWNYVQGILRNLEANGVQSLADWEAQDAAHRRKNGSDSQTAEVYDPGENWEEWSL